MAISFSRDADGTYTLSIEDRLVGRGFSFDEVLRRIDEYERNRGNPETAAEVRAAC